MNLDDLKSAWKHRHDELASDHVDALAADIYARTARVESAIRRRDRVEAAAAVLVLVVFGLFLCFVTIPIIMQLGVGIIMLAVVEVVVVMSWTRRRDAEPRHDAPLLQFCSAEITRLDRQIALLRRVMWWYSGPMLLGAAVMMYGLLDSVPELSAGVRYGFLAAFYGCFAAAGIIIQSINRRTVTTTLVPMRDELKEIVRTARQGESNGE
jgi:acyl-CoA synthetase (AMP-forming)/AMP-acid ligase II